jgi:hypothetical protein
MLPPNGVVGATMLGICAALLLGYAVHARAAFAGPQISLAALEDSPE